MEIKNFGILDRHNSAIEKSLWHWQFLVFFGKLIQPLLTGIISNSIPPVILYFPKIGSHPRIKKCIIPRKCSC